MTVSYDAVAFDLFGTLVDAHGRAIAGAARAIDAVRNRRWAIVTSCGSTYTRELIESAGLTQPSLLIGAGDVTRTKPSPECYRLAASRLGVVPEKMLVIEDSVEGVTAARNAGADVLAIGSFERFGRLALYTADSLAIVSLKEFSDGIALTIPS